MRRKPLFTDITVKSLIHVRKGDYYTIRDSAAKGESTPFIVFVHKIILETVSDFSATGQAGD